MKRLKYFLLIVALLISGQLLTACTGYIVGYGPPEPHEEVIIVAPSPRYVWVPGYYTFTGGTYIWIEGRYQIPPRGKTRYVQGDWVKTHKGYKRGKGHWK